MLTIEIFETAGENKCLCCKGFQGSAAHRYRVMLKDAESTECMFKATVVSSVHVESNTNLQVHEHCYVLNVHVESDSDWHVHGYGCVFLFSIDLCNNH